MFQRLIYKEIGIHLADHKLTLVQSRLRKWLIKYELDSYKSLYTKIESDKSGQMLMILVNAITTNVTSFFREDTQWLYMRENLKNLFDYKKKQIRIWSAACSSGQEPYSIIMFLKEYLEDFHNWDIKILATDISEDILKKAQLGVYKYKDIQNIPNSMMLKSFNSKKLQDNTKEYIIRDELKKHITFRLFNLVTDSFDIFKNKFDIIFCRNVMIYFNHETQNKLFYNFSKILKEDASLFIGHSESIQNNDNIYKLMSSSIYKLNKGR